MSVRLLRELTRILKHGVGIEEAGTANKKLEGHCQTRSEGYWHNLEWIRRDGDKQSRMESTCGPMHPSGCGM